MGRLLGARARQPRPRDGKKTSIVYTADLVRGLDVFEVDLPGRDLSEVDEGGLPLPVPLP